MNRRDLLGITLAAIGAQIISEPLSRAEEKPLARPAAQVKNLMQQATETSDHPLVTMSLIEVPPGGDSIPHRHSGPVVGYVLEGELVLEIEGRPPQKIKAGEPFYEPPGGIHMGAKNASAENRLRFIATIIGQPGQPATVPAKPMAKHN